MWIKVPETIKVVIEENFRNVMSKDIIRLIGDLGADGATYKLNLPAVQ